MPATTVNPGAEAEANLRVQDMYPRLEEVLR